MKVIVHDLGNPYQDTLQKKCDIVVNADGKYAPCQGCFGCWTTHPAKCYMKDSLQEICRVIGQADELIIITENCYGSYSCAVKNILDRSIGTSTPLSTYRGKQMHHTLRYGKHKMLKVFSYGDISAAEKSTFEYLVKRNAINYGYKDSQFLSLETVEELEDMGI